MLQVRAHDKFQERRRTVKAVELAAEGWSYEEIAVQLGYKDSAGPRMAVSRHLRKLAKVPAETVFQQMLNRLDRALKAIMPLVDDGDLNAIQTMLKLETQRARLYGLDKGTIAADEAKSERGNQKRKPAYTDDEAGEILKALSESGGLADLLPSAEERAALFLPDGVIYDDSDIPMSEEDPDVIEALASEFRAQTVGEVVVLPPGARW